MNTSKAAVINPQRPLWAFCMSSAASLHPIRELQASGSHPVLTEKRTGGRLAGKGPGGGAVEGGLGDVRQRCQALPCLLLYLPTQVEDQGHMLGRTFNAGNNR